MVIFVEVDACVGSRSIVSVLSDEAVDGAEADTLLTTEDTIERSTRDAGQPRRVHQPICHLQILLSLTFVW